MKYNLPWASCPRIFERMRGRIDRKQLSLKHVVIVGKRCKKGIDLHQIRGCLPHCCKKGHDRASRCKLQIPRVNCTTKATPFGNLANLRPSK